MKKSMKLQMIGFSIFLLLSPFILDKLIFSNSYVSNVTNDGWAGFFGSYIGGAIGGIGTLMAVYFTIHQTNEQIMRAEQKDEYRRIIDETDAIAKLVAEYLSDLQIYHSIKTECDAETQKLDYTFEQQLKLFKIDRKSRYFGGFSSYKAELEKSGLSTEFMDRFCNDYGFTCDQNTQYNKYEELLEERVQENKKYAKAIECKKTEALQKYVLGNTSYMLLGLKLSGISESSDLLLALQAMHQMLISKLSFSSSFLPDSSGFIELETKIKNETEKFIKSYRSTSPFGAKSNPKNSSDDQISATN